MIVRDSSDSDSPKSEPPLKRRPRKSTVDALIEEPSSQLALGRRTHEEMDVDPIREEVPFKRTSPEKKTRKDDNRVTNQTSKDNQRHTLAAPGDVPFKPQPSDTVKKVLFKLSFRACKRC